MILTHQILDQGKSRKGSWGSVQLKLLGVRPFNNSGWKDKLIGKNFPDKIINDFLRLKDAHLNNQVEYNGACKICRKFYKKIQRWEADKILDKGVAAKPSLPEHECRGKARYQLPKETDNTTTDPIDEFFYMTQGI